MESNGFQDEVLPSNRLRDALSVADYLWRGKLNPFDYAT
jgi:hypothetical protein